MLSPAPRTSFKHDVLPRLLPALLATLMLLAGRGAHAENRTFVINDGEGYGIMDCLTNGSSCGRVVADAWCEAHGYGPARAFGPVSDVTGATPVTTAVPTHLAEAGAVVSCDE